MTQPIDWSQPIETDDDQAKPLIAHERLEVQKMRWVHIEGGDEGWDGWYVKDDGQPQFDEESGGPAVRNRLEPAEALPDA